MTEIIVDKEEIEEIVRRILSDVKTRDAEIIGKAIKILASSIDKLSNSIEKVFSEIREELKRHNKTIEELSREIREFSARITSIGYRYGIYTEEALRSGIKYLVEDLLREYKVVKWRYYDSEGVVYGYPSEIDVDVLISDDKHVIIEYKAFVDKSDVAELYRIGKLYEKIKGVKPYLLIIAPNIRRRAKELADKLHIETRGNIIE